MAGKPKSTKAPSALKKQLEEKASGVNSTFPVGTPLSQVHSVLVGLHHNARLAASTGSSNAMNRMRFANLYGNLIDNPGQQDYGSFDFNSPQIQNQMKLQGKDRNYINSYQPSNYQQSLTSEQTRQKHFVGPPEAPQFLDGGQLYGQGFLPEYGFGSWLKENAGGLLKGAGALSKFLPPPISTIAGPILNIAGGVVSKVQAKNAETDAQQAQADSDQAALDEAAAAQEETQRLSGVNTRSAGLRDQAKDFATYGSSVALAHGGQIGSGITGQQAQITDYSGGNTHQEGIGGIPVDAKGNPATVSNRSAVGLTEKGEVTWNGYVFSDKLKFKA